MVNKKTISEIINEIYDIWDEVNGKRGGIKQAIIELQKVFLQRYNTIVEIEDKRLVLHPLTTALLLTNKPENIQSAKFYSKLLIDEFNAIPNYKIKNKHKYCKALNNYIESHKDVLSKEEKIKAYEEYYEVYKFCTPKDLIGYFNKLTAEFNINLLKEDYNMIYEIVDILLHNNNKQYQDQLDGFLKEIEKTDINIYNNVLLLISDKNKEIKIS
jgi:hypothetical protein